MKTWFGEILLIFRRQHHRQDLRIWQKKINSWFHPFVTARFHVRTPLMEQWKESFVIVNIGKEGGTVLYFSCSYDWLFLSPSFFLSPCQKIIVVKGFLFTQDMILRSPQALCIYALFGESLSKSHFMVMAYDCVNGKLWNRSLWLFPMNTWISYRAKQSERSPLLDFFHMTFFQSSKNCKAKIFAEIIHSWNWQAEGARKQILHPFWNQIGISIAF